MNPRYVIDWTDEEQARVRTTINRIVGENITDAALHEIADLAIATAFYQVKYRIIKDPMQLAQAVKQSVDTNTNYGLTSPRDYALDQYMVLLGYAGEQADKIEENIFAVNGQSLDGSAYYVERCFVEMYYE